MSIYDPLVCLGPIPKTTGAWGFSRSSESESSQRFRCGSTSFGWQKRIKSPKFKTTERTGHDFDWPFAALFLVEIYNAFLLQSEKSIGRFHGELIFSSTQPLMSHGTRRMMMNCCRWKKGRLWIPWERNRFGGTKTKRPSVVSSDADNFLLPKSKPPAPPLLNCNSAVFFFSPFFSQGIRDFNKLTRIGWFINLDSQRILWVCWRKASQNRIRKLEVGRIYESLHHFIHSLWAYVKIHRDEYTFF